MPLYPRFPLSFILGLLDPGPIPACGPSFLSSFADGEQESPSRIDDFKAYNAWQMVSQRALLPKELEDSNAKLRLRPSKRRSKFAWSNP